MRILSGIQPTGSMHIGNYLGAAKQWLKLQEDHECFFMVVDLHALTVAQNPASFSKETKEKIVELLAIGLRPETCTLFLQSSVKEHAELAWIFNTITPVSELERMTQFKDKSKKHKQNINAGLLTYPALMAADILLYKTEGVPVGKDQEQHIELTRTIARKFNTTYGQTFAEPKSLIQPEGAKIMSLIDPTKKMSKSDGEANYLSLFEEPESIQKKIMRATTDKGKDIKYNPDKKPGISNLMTIFSLFANMPMKKVEQKFHGKGYAQFKKSLADLLVKELEPLRRKKQELLQRDLYIQEILRQGQRKASSVAQDTMKEVRKKVGLLSLE
ncbi:MAG: tryptophan--tRNA ligase [bacterium]|nr:tryptophan--tRNA ligase [bacterium]